MFKIEMHTHTYPGSCDSELKSKELVHKFAELGYSGLVLTNHFSEFQCLKYYLFTKIGCTSTKDCKECEQLCNTVLDREKAVKSGYQLWLNDIREAKEYGEHIGFKVYAGCEYEVYKAHISVLGLTLEDMEAHNLPVNATLEDLKALYPSALFIQNHANRNYQNLVAGVDGYELFNTKGGRHKYEMDAREYLTRHFEEKEWQSKINIVGGDVHKAIDVGRSAVVFDSFPEDERELAKLLREGKYKNLVTCYI